MNRTADPFARGGGCACKIPAGARGLRRLSTTGRATQPGAAEVLVGLDDGDDAAAVRIDAGVAVLSTADFFTPVVDDAYDWGRIAAANALSDIYAMGGTPVMAINLVGWPRERLSMELLQEVLRGGLDVAAEARCPVIGGHSIDGPEPTYGMAVTGIADPKVLRNEPPRPQADQPHPTPGLGFLNNRHRPPGDQRRGRRRDDHPHRRLRCRLAAGVRAATDVTGFGLLDTSKDARPQRGPSASTRPPSPTSPGRRDALAAGHVPEGRAASRLVRPHLTSLPASTTDELILLRTHRPPAVCSSWAGPGAPVVGETVAGGLLGAVSSSRWCERLDPFAVSVAGDARPGPLQLSRLTCPSLDAHQGGALLVDTRTATQPLARGSCPRPGDDRTVLEWRLDPTHPPRPDAGQAHVHRRVPTGLQLVLCFCSRRRFGVDATDMVGGVDAWLSAGCPRLTGRPTCASEPPSGVLRGRAMNGSTTPTRAMIPTTVSHGVGPSHDERR